MRAALVTLIALVAATPTANAGEIGVVVTGDPSMQAAVATHLEHWLVARGETPITSPLSAEAVTTLMDCLVIDDQKCARLVVDARAKTPNLVYAHVEIATRGARDITFTAYWFVSGHAPIAERRVCEQCTDESWHGIVDAMLSALASGIPVEPARPRAVTHSDDRGSSRLGPAILLGAGIALLGTGAVYLYYGSLGGAEQRYIYPDSTPVGIGLVAVGVGATIGGTILLAQSGRRSTPVATIGPNGGYVGWLTRF